MRCTGSCHNTDLDVSIGAKRDLKWERECFRKFGIFWKNLEYFGKIWNILEKFGKSGFF